jgi:hypothetical protein
LQKASKFFRGPLLAGLYKSSINEFNEFFVTCWSDCASNSQKTLIAGPYTRPAKAPDSTSVVKTQGFVDDAVCLGEYSPGIGPRDLSRSPWKGGRTMVRDTGTRVLTAVVFVVAIALAGNAIAAAKESFRLMGQEDSPKAKGTAVIQDDRLSVTASGLKPNAVYTVWFVNMQPTMTQEGAGSPPYVFRTDKRGHATYKATLHELPIGKWQSIMIVRHPSGDPKDMSQMKDALMAKLM